jgi:hypothetical protein
LAESDKWKRTGKMKKLATLTLCVLSLSAFAQSSASNVSSADASKSTFDKIKEQWDLSYSAEFYGPSLSETGTRPTDTGADSDRDLRYDNQIAIDYKLDNGKEITTRIRWRNEFGDGSRDERATMKGTRIGLQGVWYEAGNFTYFARYQLELPTNSNPDYQYQVGAAQDFSFRISDKIVSGLENSTYYYFANGTDYGYMYNAAYFNMALTDMATWKSRLEYELFSQDGNGKRNSPTNLQKDSSRLISGVDLQINNSWSIYPHLIYGTDGNLFENPAKRTGIGFWLSGAIF